jgi:hypothetical protein
MSTAATLNNTTVLDFTANVQTIERNTVASSSRASYISTLANFVVFLYTTAGYQKYLKQDAITATFDPAAKKDEDARKEADTANQKKKKRKRTAKKDTKTVKWSHPHLYDEAKRLLGLMNRSTPGACPINLTGDNRITYEVITSFMATKKKLAKVDKHLADSYHRTTLGGQNEPIVLDGPSNEEVEVLVRMSESTYGSIQSSVAFLFRESGVKVPDEISSSMSVYMKGSKRLGKSAKQSLGLSLDEGKKPMSKVVYMKLCEWLFQSSDKEHIFAHLFLVLDWYVM